MSTPIQAAVNFHESYFISDYEMLSKTAKAGARFLQTPLRVAASFFSYSVSFVGLVSSQAAAIAILTKNALFSRGTDPENQDRLLKSFRPELLGRIKTAERRLTPLSALCTEIFETDVQFAALLNSQRTAGLATELNLLLTGNPPLERKHQIDEALSHINQTLTDLTAIKQIRARKIAPEDIVYFHNALQKNLLFSTSLWAALENIGEWAGGRALQLLPTRFNPAERLSTLLSSPTTGALLSHIALDKILPMLPAHIRGKIERLPARFAITALLTLIYYCFLGPYVGDIGHYKVGLLFNYLGMCAFGTEETLPDYARKMTPATLVGSGTSLLLDFYGAPYEINFLISFFLSHVAYNAKTYKDIIQGRLISFPERALSEGLSRFEVRTARERFSRAYLDSLLTSPAGEFLPENLFFSLRALTMISGLSKRLLDAALPLQELMRTQQLLSPTSSSLNQGIENLDEALGALKIHLKTPELPLLARSLNAFFSLLQTIPWSHLFDAYKAELTLSVQRGLHIEALYTPAGPPPPPQLRGMRQRMLQKVLIESGIPTGLLDRIKGHLAIICEKLHTDIQPIAGSLEENIRSSLYPCLATSDETSAFATEMLDLLIFLFIAHFTAKTTLLNHDNLLTMGDLTEAEKSSLMRNISTLIFKTRLPKERKVAELTLRSQL